MLLMLLNVTDKVPMLPSDVTDVADQVLMSRILPVPPMIGDRGAWWEVVRAPQLRSAGTRRSCDE